jgi:hypothetical protein
VRNSGGNASAYTTPVTLPAPRPQQQSNNANGQRSTPQVDTYRPQNNTSYGQPPPYAFGSHASISPPNMDSPVTFGQTSIPSQHARPFASPNPPSNYGDVSYSNSTVFPPNSPFASYEPFGNQTYPPSAQQSNGATSSPGPGNNSGLRLPPMRPPTTYQQQQQHSFTSPSAYQGGGWRSDGSEYGSYYNSGSPP